LRSKRWGRRGRLSTPSHRPVLRCVSSIRGRRDSKRYPARALAWLTTVQLAPEAACQLRRLERLYRAVHADAIAADADVKARAARDPIACALATITGVGPVLGLTLRAEIGDATRFPGGPALASYAGLVPRVESSGERIYHGRITRQGSRWIRWALVEAARYATRRPGGILFCYPDGRPPRRSLNDRAHLLVGSTAETWRRRLDNARCTRRRP
jgi:transposase